MTSRRIVMTLRPNVFRAQTTTMCWGAGIRDTGEVSKDETLVATS
jgi:hypothetical protein